MLGVVADYAILTTTDNTAEDPAEVWAVDLDGLALSTAALSLVEFESKTV